MIAQPRTNGWVGCVGLAGPASTGDTRAQPRLGWRYTYVCLGGATADPSIESAPPPVYAGGSTALKTISMSCSGKASLDTPIRLLAH